MFLIKWVSFELQGKDTISHCVVYQKKNIYSNHGVVVGFKRGVCGKIFMFLKI
jgi:hypothetical protein